MVRERSGVNYTYQKIGFTLTHPRYFLTILFKNAGVATQNQLLTLNFANTVVSAVGALIGTSLTDKSQFSSSLVQVSTNFLVIQLEEGTSGSGVPLLVLGH